MIKYLTNEDFVNLIAGMLCVQDDIMKTRKKIDEEDGYADNFCEYGIFGKPSKAYYAPQSSIIPYTSNTITLYQEEYIDEENTSPITYVIVDDEQICPIDMQDLISMRETIKSEIIPILDFD